MLLFEQLPDDGSRRIIYLYTYIYSLPHKERAEATPYSTAGQRGVRTEARTVFI